MTPTDRDAQAADQASEQARFAALEFLVRFAREMGAEPSAVVTDRMLFAYEMGYLRGRSDAAREASKRFDDLSQTREASKRFDDLSQTRDACKEGEDDGDSE